MLTELRQNNNWISFMTEAFTSHNKNNTTGSPRRSPKNLPLQKEKALNANGKNSWYKKCLQQGRALKVRLTTLSCGLFSWLKRQWKPFTICIFLEDLFTLEMDWLDEFNSTKRLLSRCHPICRIHPQNHAWIDPFFGDMEILLEHEHTTIDDRREVRPFVILTHFLTPTAILCPDLSHKKKWETCLACYLCLSYSCMPDRFESETPTLTPTSSFSEVPAK